MRRAAVRSAGDAPMRCSACAILCTGENLVLAFLLRTMFNAKEDRAPNISRTFPSPCAAKARAIRPLPKRANEARDS